MVKWNSFSLICARYNNFGGNGDFYIIFRCSKYGRFPVTRSPTPHSWNGTSGTMRASLNSMRGDITAAWC
ncbi:hypothetical protein K1T71_014436 [Dendrolimus kikuchii]|uniref:Uncharacterized protein n=1 Tax=Dendrolimus kikuchii TaxID=765133 RepID=A0ACC1CE07_9NEOP|nr:hypothetical protein K1T71_014436 [Dendrolimus kikuchii]